MPGLPPDISGESAERLVSAASDIAALVTFGRHR
jgi:hypothetical protein